MVTSLALSLLVTLALPLFNMTTANEQHDTAAAPTTPSSSVKPEDSLLFRIEVQNLPPGLSTLQPFPRTIRLPRPLSLQQLELFVSQQVAVEGLGVDDSQLEFDLEVFSFEDQRFVALESLHQLRKRSRLNVILKKLPGDVDTTCVALPYKMFDISSQGVQGRAFRINNRPVVVEQVGNSGKGTGLTTWDGAVVLAKYLEHATLTTREMSLYGKKVVEVGAGTGLVGIATAMLGAHDVVLTDLPYTMENLERNIRLNTQSFPELEQVLSTQVIDWFEPPQEVGEIDLILAADVVWVPELIAPLVNALHALVTRAKSSRPHVLMSYQKRSRHSDQLLFEHLRNHQFTVSRLPRDRFHPEFVSDRIEIFEFSIESS